MNALTSLFSTALPRPQNRSNVLPMISRPAKRERGFGIGYGSSSGYATSARYGSAGTSPRVRFG